MNYLSSLIKKCGGGVNIFVNSHLNERQSIREYLESERNLFGHKINNLEINEMVLSGVIYEVRCVPSIIDSNLRFSTCVFSHSLNDAIWKTFQIIEEEKVALFEILKNETD